MGRKSRTDEYFPNRIRELRLRRRLTLEQLAEQVGLTKSALARIETGESQLKFLHVGPLARALDVDAPEILFDLSDRPVAISGRVIDGGAVVSAEAIDQVECPRGINPDEADVLLVEGDALAPIEAQSLLFVGTARAPSADIIGRLGVVELKGGAHVVRQVRRGYSPGRYNLISANAAPIEDAEIVAFSRVLMIGGRDTLSIWRIPTADGDDEASAEPDASPQRRALLI